ncbi:hypothetical protein AKJ09_07489 [Labilithrix luteola]|uniref:Uncharacterized protein n=1 Tax=Labilithrix luteola TaxID=1391654 RepID=A0A0K1Q4S1_9BACT|nr:hypothetical protein [Labilithrix luteola]AKV00826.1 hypothetical protein AKJ09_07489 [Labilithrix luteola]
MTHPTTTSHPMRSQCSNFDSRAAIKLDHASPALARKACMGCTQ